MPLHLETLGGFSLSHAGGNDSALGPGKPLAVLTYLATNGHREASREELLDLLWANLPPERGRHALRQTLHSLRRAIGADCLDSSVLTARLVQPLASDHDEFLAAVQQHDLTRAITLYRGPFLHNLALPGGNAFEEWRDHTARRLHRMWRGMAEAATDAALARGAHDEALQRAVDFRSRDPEHEPFWRLLITAHLQAGNSRAARLEADGLQHLLHENGTRPLPATAELLDRLGRTARSPVPATTDPLARPDLVGRDAEFSLLLGAWRHAIAGTPQIVHLEGEAGIGKSRLLDALDERISSLAGTVASCRAVPGGRHHPLSFLAACVDQVARLGGAKGVEASSATTIVRLVPTLQRTFPGVTSPGDGIPDEHRLLAATIDLLRAVTFETPVALFLDDLHWADAASLELLGLAIARIDAAPLLVVSTSRLAGGLPGVAGVEKRLPPLDAAAITELLSQLGDLADDDAAWLVTALVDATHGSPLLLLDALRTLLGNGGLGLQDGVITVRDAALVRAALQGEAPVRQRVRALGTGPRRALELIAVAGHPLPRTTFEAIPSAPAALDAALASLELGGLAREGVRGWDVSHDRYAEAALAEMPPDEVATAHRELADALRHVTSPDRGGALIRALGHAVQGGGTAMYPELARAWLAHQRHGGVRGNARRQLAAYATSAGARAVLPALRRGLPWQERLPGRLGLAATMLLLLIGTVAGTSWWLDQPVALQLENVPSVLPNLDNARALRNDAPPVFSIRNRRGKISRALDGAELRVVSSRGADSTTMIEAAVVEDGLVSAASFQLWASVGWDSLVASFGVGRLTTEPILLGYGYRHYALSLVGGLVNGQRLEPVEPTIRVAPGDSITGYVILEYDTPSIPVLWMAARSSTFPEAQPDTATVASLLTGATGATLVPRLHVVAPTVPGSYWLVWAQAAEASAVWIFSRTNWACQTPVWHDGDDLLDVPDSVLRAVWGGGLIGGTRRLCPEDRTPYQDPSETAAVSVRVVVE